ncbi:MAG: sulfite exporter TauE/SafE family protein [Shimia sp.]
MLDFTPLFFALAIPATLFAGISKAGFGSGAAFASSALLALILPPTLALGIMLPLLMLIDAASLRPYWMRWNWREAQLLILAGVPGVALGALLFGAANPDVLRILIGTVSLAFVAWSLAKGWGWIATSDQPLATGWGVLTGAVAGFTSFVSHAGGPPIAIYLLSQRLEKLTYQATTVLVFWAVNLMKFGPYAWTGAFTRDTWLAVLMLAPVALLGTWLGIRAHRAIPALWFFRVTYAMLTVTGLKLIWDALA